MAKMDDIQLIGLIELWLWLDLSVHRNVLTVYSFLVLSANLAN